MHFLIAGLFALFILVAIFALDARLIVRQYTLSVQTFDRPVWLVLLADHHSTRYGKRQARLLREIDAINPDAILIAGDMIDRWRAPGETLHLYNGLRRYRTYYAIGNHECDYADLDAVKAQARSHGITVLGNETVIASIAGGQLVIGGIDDPERAKHDNTQYDHRAAARKLTRRANACPGYRILIAHKPEYIEQYLGFDLVVSGHAHGGQVRIPGLVNGLFAPGQGLFPKWVGGVYQHEETTHVVSRGLARFFFLPRVFNRPELVVIELTGENTKEVTA